MSAKDTLRRNKTDIQTALCGDYRLILTKVHEKNLITPREYNNLKSINKEDVEGHVVELVDKIMNKGEERCQDFLSLLQTDEDIKDTLPVLKDMQWNNTSLLPKPVQATSVVDSVVLPQGSKRRKERECYTLDHNPRGLCVVINNEEFPGTELRRRGGTQEDATALREVFTRLGFTVVVHDNLTAANIRLELKKLGSRNFLDEDALVVCVLSHGEKDCVFGTDEQKVFLRELRQPFSSGQAPTLAGKPKLFFIQACQGRGYQRGSMPSLPRPEPEGDRLEDDTGPVRGETVPWDADFLLGMATVQECVSFRIPSTGSIYIQELCMQLTRSAESSEMDDILTVLTRVNREVSKGEYKSHKQMPEPKYTLTKKLVLRYVS